MLVTMYPWRLAKITVTAFVVLPTLLSAVLRLLGDVETSYTETVVLSIPSYEYISI